MLLLAATSARSELRQPTLVVAPEDKSGAALTRLLLAQRRPSAFQAGHMPSWHGSCECRALSPAAAGSGCPLLLLSPLLSSTLPVRAWSPSHPAAVFVRRPFPHRTD